MPLSIIQTILNVEQRTTQFVGDRRVQLRTYSKFALQLLCVLAVRVNKQMGKLKVEVKMCSLQEARLF
jgi:hypothetical protein